MSKTPRTDAAQFCVNHEHMNWCVVTRATATTLERELAAVTAERDEARKERDRALRCHDNVLEALRSTIAERDAALAEVAERASELRDAYQRIDWLEQQREVEAHQKESALNESAECLEERDSLRDQLETLGKQCAAMRGALNYWLKINAEVNKLNIGNQYLPETEAGFLCVTESPV